MRKLTAYDRTRILDEIQRHLEHGPTSPSRNKKLLVDLLPPWEANPPIWELRIGEYRVFYDISAEQETVYVRAVRRKATGKTTEEIL